MTRDQNSAMASFAAPPEAGDPAMSATASDLRSLGESLALLCQGPLVELAALAQRSDESWLVLAVADRSGRGPAVGDELVFHLAERDGTIASSGMLDQMPAEDLAGWRYNESEGFASGLYVFVPMLLSSGDEYGLFVQPSRASEILARWIASECERTAVQIAAEIEHQLTEDNLEAGLMPELERSTLTEQMITAPALDLRDRQLGISEWTETLLQQTSAIDVIAAKQLIGFQV